MKYVGVSSPAYTIGPNPKFSKTPLPIKKDYNYPQFLSQDQLAEVGANIFKSSPAFTIQPVETQKIIKRPLEFEKEQLEQIANTQRQTLDEEASIFNKSTPRDEASRPFITGTKRFASIGNNIMNLGPGSYYRKPKKNKKIGISMGSRFGNSIFDEYMRRKEQNKIKTELQNLKETQKTNLEKEIESELQSNINIKSPIKKKKEIQKSNKKKIKKYDPVPIKEITGKSPDIKKQLLEEMWVAREYTQKNGNLGPGEYRPKFWNDKIGNEKVGGTFSKAKREQKNYNDVSPGPTSIDMLMKPIYEMDTREVNPFDPNWRRKIRSKTISAPKLLKPKLDYVKPRVPSYVFGPGYDPNILKGQENLKKNLGNQNIVIENESETTTEENLGNEGLDRPTFGKEKRIELTSKKDATPGPGEYLGRKIKFKKGEGVANGYQKQIYQRSPKFTFQGKGYVHKTFDMSNLYRQLENNKANTDEVRKEPFRTIGPPPAVNKSLKIEKEELNGVQLVLEDKLRRIPRRNVGNLAPGHKIGKGLRSKLYTSNSNNLGPKYELKSTIPQLPPFEQRQLEKEKNLVGEV